MPSHPQHSPHAWIQPNYGTATQLTAPLDTSTLLPPASLTHLQEVISTLLYYARAIDSTMLNALGSIASAQAHGAKATDQAITQPAPQLLCHTL